jgi:uncharacterized protein (DUF302 family)
MTPDGMTVSRSALGPKATSDRLVAQIAAHGMSVFARIDHAAAAKAVGLDLLPTEVLIFGAARGGTPLMQAAQTAGIDLPLKLLVWQDAVGDTWVGYNNPPWLAVRHGIAGADDAIGAMTKALSALASSVATD